MNKYNNRIDNDSGNNTKYQITVIGRDTTVLLEYDGYESVLDTLIKNNIYVSADCGGRGTCGKCRMQLLEGKLNITDSDRAAFSEEELRRGFRLLCKAFPESDCTIKLSTIDEEDFDIVKDFGITKNFDITKDYDKVKNYDILENFDTITDSNMEIDLGIVADLKKLERSANRDEDNYAIAIDIGTTTLAISLIERLSGTILLTHTALNKQRIYGADVISRIQASNTGKSIELRESIQKDLLTGIREVIHKTGIRKENIDRITIAANTTMGHLLLGYSCRTLGSYPFIPVNIKKIELPFEKAFDSGELGASVILLPGISTFVGSDITAGLLLCDFDQTEAPCLFIDLGTNGEMAVGNKNRILATSTAAGPAFEGGNISCGVGSITGAICNADMIGDKLHYKTIGEGTPVGICGTGVIEIAAELIKAGLMDATGLLTDDYFESGYPLGVDKTGKAITFTQKDIRELQLAKAAVRAGIELLLRRYEITYEDIATVYLAGGFGYKINIQKAIDIGLLPRQLSGKIKAIGNSSLGGAIKYVVEDSVDERLDHLIKVTEEFHLSNDKEFNELYITHMYF